MLQPKEQGFQSISVLSSMRATYEEGNTIPTFLAFLEGETNLPVVPPQIAADLKSEKHHFGIYNNGWIEFDEETKMVIDVIKRVKLASLEQASETKSIRDLGEFTVKSGAIRFTDPCYDNDTWCKGSMPAVNGQWQARIGFFRDSYDEKSLKDGIAIQTKAIEIVKTLSLSVKSELEEVNKVLKEFVKEHRPKKIPFRQLNLSELTKPIVDDIVNFSNENIKPHSWRTPSESALSTLLDILGLILGISHRIPDRWSYRIAMADFKANKENAKTEEARYEDAKIILLDALDACVERGQKAFDEGRPRRIQFLHIKHESVAEFTSFNQQAWLEGSEFDVGVDSGQAGFFDEGWYQNDYGGDKDDDNRGAYFTLCNLSSDESREGQSGGTFEFGVNSSTAHGDGSAPLYYRTNEKGEVIEAVYHYDVAYDEEEEEDE